MKKRGISHIEVILSFILFAGAVGFALYFFNPVGDRSVETVKDYALREIKENASIEIDEYFIVIHNESIISASPIDGKIAINISGVDVNKKGAVFTREGTQLKAEREGDFVKTDPDTLGWEDIDFITIVLAENISENAGVGSVNYGEAYNLSFYTVSRVEKKKIIFEGKLLELNKSYYENYLEVKKEFNLPNRADFGFRVSFADGYEIFADRKIPDGYEIFSEEKRAEILRKNGEIDFAELTIKVW